MQSVNGSTDPQDKMSRRSFLKAVAGAGALVATGAGAVYYLLSPRQSSEPVIAYCGINCAVCPDGRFRVSCDGCPSTSGRISTYASQTCKVRPCALDKNIKNCAYCSSYGCEKLRVIHDRFPDAKATLDKVRRNL